jgi:hypothetical protein
MHGCKANLRRGTETEPEADDDSSAIDCERDLEIFNAPSVTREFTLLTDYFVNMLT